MKKKIAFLLIIVMIATGLIWYLTPKTFAKNVNPDDVVQFSVFDGQTGTGFMVNDPTYIKMILRNLQNTPVKRSGISLGNMGYGFKIEGLDADGKTIIPIFIINSETTIRKDPFFYTCEGGLCFDFLKELEPDLSSEKNVNEK